MESNKLQLVYDSDDIRILLGLGRKTTYDFLEEVYKNQSPFAVFKIGKLYKIPKESFNKWISGQA